MRIKTFKQNTLLTYAEFLYNVENEISVMSREELKEIDSTRFWKSYRGSYTQSSFKIKEKYRINFNYEIVGDISVNSQGYVDVVYTILIPIVYILPAIILSIFIFFDAFYILTCLILFIYIVSHSIEIYRTNRKFKKILLQKH